MEKTINKVIIVFAVIVLCVASVSFADEKQKVYVSKNSAQVMKDLPGLEYYKVDEETILITKGFNYIKAPLSNETLSLFKPRGTIEILEVIDNTFFVKGWMFKPRFVLTDEENREIEEQLRTPGYHLDVRGIYDSIGMKWVFIHPGITFRVKGLIFKSLFKDATIEFLEEGVLLKGFEIKPLKK